MALHKVIAGGYRDVDVEEDQEVVESGVKKTIKVKKQKKVWVEGREVMLHPLEEEAELKRWAIHDVQIQLPPPISQQDEINWLIENGPEFVKQKREEYRLACEALQPALDAVNESSRKAYEAWNEHCELCFANNLDPDTFDGDARQKLTNPQKDGNNAT
jgi:hypothetical protein